MPTSLPHTRVFALLLALGLAIGLAAAGGAAAAGEPPASNEARAASSDVRSTAEDAALRQIDAALESGRYNTALVRIREVVGAIQGRPDLHWRAAQAYYHLGMFLGDAEVCTIVDGRVGQFVGGCLLVEQRPGRWKFLCCSRDSALYQIRRALDGGIDTAAAHVMHAQIWRRMGRADVGLTILRKREAQLLEDGDDAVLAAFCDVALDADAISDHLRYARLRAHRAPERRERILFDSCLAVAERYCRRGEEALYIQWMCRALRHDPEDREVLLRLADAEWEAGRPGEAIPLYRRLLRLEPEHPQRPRILKCLASERGP